MSSSSSGSEADCDWAIIVTGGSTRVAGVAGVACRKEGLGMLRRKGIVGMR